MANLEVKNSPEFTDEIYKTEREDLLTAELENEIKGKLLNNDVFLKEKLQEETSRAQRAEENLTNSLQEETNRAQAAEETNKNNLAAHVGDKANPHKVTKAQVGLGNVNNTADMNKPVSTAQQNAIDAAYQQATGYTDQKIADLIGGAPETLDTLKEVADAIQTNKDVSAALDAAIGKKANQAELDTHTGNNTIHITSQERTNWNDANTKKHIHSNKGVLDKITQALLDNWNAAYTHISDAVKHITAAERTLWNTVSNKVDKVSGKGLSSNDYTTAEKNKLEGIAANANNYAHPTTAGNKHIPAGGSSGQILRWSADGTAIWGSDNNTTYSAASQSAAGLMSAADKKKLDGIAAGANNYTHPNTSGNKHIPSGGSSGQILRWSADGTAVWGNDNNTTYSAATQSANGLMSSTDKKKLDRIAEGANKTVVDSALSSTSTNPVQNKIIKNAIDGKANSNHLHNNSRQVLRCESGNTIVIKYPSKTKAMGASVLSFALDSIKIYMSYAGYGGGTYDQSLNLLYGTDVKGYFNLTNNTVNNSDGTTTLTLTRSKGFSQEVYIQLEYTAGITSITVN